MNPLTRGGFPPVPCATSSARRSRTVTLPGITTETGRLISFASTRDFRAGSGPNSGDGGADRRRKERGSTQRFSKDAHHRRHVGCAGEPGNRSCILARYPLPNDPTGCVGARDIRSVFEGCNGHGNQFSIRVDPQDLRQCERLFTRFILNTSTGQRRSGSTRNRSIFAVKVFRYQRTRGELTAVNFRRA